MKHVSETCFLLTERESAAHNSRHLECTGVARLHVAQVYFTLYVCPLSYVKGSSVRFRQHPTNDRFSETNMKEPGGRNPAIKVFLIQVEAFAALE